MSLSSPSRRRPEGGGGGTVAVVVANSFGTRWQRTWLPAGFAGRWCELAWRECQLDDVPLSTMQITLTVVAISLAIGVPAAGALAR